MTSKNNSASQWDNGVNMLKSRVFTDAPKFVTGLVIVCAHITGAAAVCHLSARRRNVSELYFEQCFSDVLAYRRIKSWHVAGFEATVRLLATAQCQGPKLLSGRGTVPGRAISPKKKKNRNVQPVYHSHSHSQNTLHSAPTHCVHCLAWLSC